MAVSVVGNATNNASSVTLPSHLAGDLVLVWAFRISSTTPPSAPDDSWNLISTGGSSSAAYLLAWRVAPSDNSSSGAWSNASRVTAVVMRGQTGSPAVASTVNSGSGTTHSVPAISPLCSATGNGVIVKFFQNDTSPYSLTEPSGYTRILQTGPVSVFTKDATDTDASLSFSDAPTSNWLASAVHISEPTTGFLQFFL